MPKLSKLEHWDSIHREEEQLFDLVANTAKEHDRQPLRRRLIRAVKWLLPNKVFECLSNYDDYLLWDVIFKQRLPEMKGAKVLEIGSAPGEFLAKFSQRYDCVPYGVEYSEIGVALNKKIFSLYGLNPDNVIHADLFSDEFRRQYAGSFDVVMSRGFIEHFSDVGPVIARHMDFLRPGGYLIVSIPNLRGINYVLAWIFCRKLMALHNLEIMGVEAFRKLFAVRRDLQHLFCDYYGTFSFCLFEAKQSSSMMRCVLSLALRLQLSLNLTFRLFLRSRGAESKWLSPHLLFIGRKC